MPGQSGAGKGAWVVLTGRSGCPRWVQLLVAGLDCGGCQQGGVDLDIGSDEYF